MDEEIQGLLAGEENGGIFYPPHQSVRDGAMTTALIAEILTYNDTSLRSLIKDLPQYIILKSGKPCPHQAKPLVLQYLLNATEEQERSILDGVKLFYDDGSILIRPSGTEPKYRCFAEAITKDHAQQYLERGLTLLEDAIIDANKKLDK